MPLFNVNPYIFAPNLDKDIDNEGRKLSDHESEIMMVEIVVVFEDGNRKHCNNRSNNIDKTCQAKRVRQSGC